VVCLLEGGGGESGRRTNVGGDKTPPNFQNNSNTLGSIGVKMKGYYNPLEGIRGVEKTSWGGGLSWRRAWAKMDLDLFPGEKRNKCLPDSSRRAADGGM